MAVRRIFVAGAGTVGQGIAEAAATAGIEVILSDVDRKHLDMAVRSIENSLNSLIERWAITASEKRVILSRIKPVVGLKQTDGCEFAIEAVPENIDVKKDIFKRFDKTFDPDTALVTTTSALSITQIAGVTGRENKVVGMHFPFPIVRASVVEVVRALKTDDQTLQSAKQLARQMGKEVVEVNEYPGFITTRIMIPFINEAIHLVMEGIASAEAVDKAIKLGFGFPIGPLELADTIGLDDLMSMMEGLYRELGDLKYNPCPLLRRMVRDGYLGKKVGRGFFVYEKGSVKDEDTGSQLR